MTNPTQADREAAANRWISMLPREQFDMLLLLINAARERGKSEAPAAQSAEIERLKADVKHWRSLGEMASRQHDKREFDIEQLRKEKAELARVEKETIERCVEAVVDYDVNWRDGIGRNLLNAAQAIRALPLKYGETK